MRQITTQSLDRAAFFTTFHAKLVTIVGRYPNNSFILDVPHWLSWYERVGGWVPYNYFCNQRRTIKRRSRKLAGLPERFTGDGHSGFKLLDLAVWQPWNKSGK